MNIPTVTYSRYNVEGIFISSTPVISIWLYDESTKIFTLSSNETIIQENMNFYIDMSGVLIGILVS